MTPLEAYRVISRCMTELQQMRQAIYPKGKSYSQEEVSAEVIAFEALRRMEEDELAE